MRGMGSLARCGTLGVAVLVLLPACSSEDGAASSTEPTTGDSVRSAPATGPLATFGAPTTVGDLEITASNPVVESDAGGPWLTLTVRAENRSQADSQAPQFQLRCSGSAAGGAWLPTSTFKQDESVPAGSFHEGTLSLLLPGDERLGTPRRSCATPATVVATHLAFDNNGAGAPVEKRVTWAVPDELVAQLNAG